MNYQLLSLQYRSTPNCCNKVTHITIPIFIHVVPSWTNHQLLLLTQSDLRPPMYFGSFTLLALNGYLTPLQKIGTSQIQSSISLLSTLLTFYFCLSGPRRPKIVIDFRKFALKARAKKGGFKLISWANANVCFKMEFTHERSLARVLCSSFNIEWFECT